MTADLFGHDIAYRVEPGDPVAEDQRAAYFSPRILIFARVRAPDSDLAQDITQQATLSVILALRSNRLRGSDRLSAFVYGVARNVLGDRQRKSRALKRLGCRLNSLSQIGLKVALGA